MTQHGINVIQISILCIYRPLFSYKAEFLRQEHLLPLPECIGIQGLAYIDQQELYNALGYKSDNGAIFYWNKTNIILHGH